MVNILSKKSVGLDIADHTIEVVELVKTGSTIKVSSLGRFELDAGIVERGRIKDEKKLAAAVKQVFAQAKPQPIITKEVVFSLPENQVYTHVFKLDTHTKEDRDVLVLKEIQGSIPVKKERLFFSYKALHEEPVQGKKSKAEILVVAAEKDAVLEWQKFFKSLDIEVKVFDIEVLATFRGLADVRGRLANIVLVDIGAATTNIAIFDNKGLRYSYSINIAGDKLTEGIEDSLKVEKDEAERQKMVLGLSNKDEQIFFALIRSLQLISEEIKTALRYIKEKNGYDIQEMVLVGGTSQLSGILDYFSTNLDLRVRVGRPAIIDEKVENVQNSLFYIEAIGLALRGIDKRLDQKDPGIFTGIKKEPEVEEGLKIKKEEESKEEEVLITIKEKLGYDSKFFPSVSDVQEEKKTGSKKNILVALILIGIILIVGAYWFRGSSKEKGGKEPQSQIEQYTKVQTFELKIPVAVDSSEYTSDMVEGRIIENIIESAEDYNKAVVDSKTAVEKELKEGEKLWLEPVSELLDEVTFPVTIRWLVFVEEDANSLFLEEVNKLNKENIEFRLNNIKKNDIEATDDPNIFYLVGGVVVSLNELIKTEDEMEAPEWGEVLESEEEVVETSASISIKETETGWLRVRGGAGTSYQEITRVYPGETYLLLEESSGWYKIKLDEEREGWIAGRYATKE